MKFLGLLLLCCAAGAAPPVYLNHFYVVLDAPTYRKIDGNTGMQDRFAVFERRSTTRTDISYTGIYFYGDSTYFELFDRAGRGKETQTVGGIAFGVDRPGDAEQLLDAWKDAGLKPFDMLVTRGEGGKQLPWFRMFATRPRSASAAVDYWSMEYDPQFLALWHPESKTQPGVRRADILARYAAFLNQKPETKWMKDVTAIRVALDPGDAELLTAEAVKLGWTSSGGTLTGSGISIEIEPATAASRGIRQVRFSLRGAPPKPITYTFSPTCVLTLNTDATAVWNF
jgi:hypothetical protein